MRILTSALCMLISLNSLASEQLPKGGPAARLDMEPGFLETVYVVVNGKRYDIDFAQRIDEEALQAMSTNPRAVAFLEEHRSAALHGSIGLWAGVGGATAYLLMKRDNFQPAIYVSALLVGVFYGAYNLKSSQAYLMKAINAYNGVEYAPDAASNFKRSQTPDPNAIHVSLLSLSF